MGKTQHKFEIDVQGKDVLYIEQRSKKNKRKFDNLRRAAKAYSEPAPERL